MTNIYYIYNCQSSLGPKPQPPPREAQLYSSDLIFITEKVYFPKKTNIVAKG